ncbi:chymotrypsin-2-like [Episyrphus balteatus]|uniref:chymotrypsin-2-like n=1 Tax=Episyrphus balteatus TaxID=286459 RepID=UPI00248691F0|nr:chymotrypsin-2-like [Episyrphus balteatus]
MQVVTVLLVLVVSSTYAHIVRDRIKNSKVNKNKRIFGGEPAEPGFATYQVSIQTPLFEHICGGSIIGDRYILTAGHCIKNYINKHRESELQIVTGTNRYDKPGGVYYVKDLILHCNYGIKEYHNDIGLIRLNESIVFNKFTQPILLPTEPLKDGDEVVLTGWGNTDYINDLPDDLQKITLKYVPRKECLEALDNNPGLDIGHICTFTKEGEGACYGDSGSPLVKDGFVFGVVNWGFACATGKPDAQANVHFYNDWIRTQMKD